TLKKKKHWLSKVQECAVSWAGPPGEFGAEIRVPLPGAAPRGSRRGHLLRRDVLLEVNGTPVSGLTNRDTLAVIRHFREPIRLKTVKPGTLALRICAGWASWELRHLPTAYCPG
ncbi:Membrane-associated guanylate kinase, WW and PDZ domain-containing protein 3, partial [Saguinus oedipus]